MYVSFPNISIDYLDGNLYVNKDKPNFPMEFSTNIFIGTMWNRTLDLNNTHVDGDINEVR